MVTIVKKKGNKKELYYVYGYEKDPKTGKFRRKYLGISTKLEYDEYKKNLEDKHKYCKVCGKKRLKYAEYPTYCKCGKNGKNLSPMQNEVY